MVLADDRILEYIQKHDSGTPTEMRDSGYVRFGKSHISRRCKKLVEHDLLRHLGNGVYVITEKGEAYLAGDLDTGEVDDDGSGSERPASA
jgi:repressor of nif and glnA expression